MFTETFSSLVSVLDSHVEFSLLALRFSLSKSFIQLTVLSVTKELYGGRSALQKEPLGANDLK